MSEAVKPKPGLKRLDALFQDVDAGVQDGERIVMLPLSEMHYFKGYPAMQEEYPYLGQPFQVRDEDPKTIEVTASIKTNGVYTPVTVRPDPDGGYEIICGHRRHRGSELAGKTEMPSVIKHLTDEQAVDELVGSNIQRENVLPSERAWAYRMKLEAHKRKPGRPQNNSPQVAANFRSDDEVAESLGISADTLRRYVRLVELIPELMSKVDADKIKPTIAYELSFLKKPEQVQLMDAMEVEQTTPSQSQAQRLKKFSQEGQLTPESMRAIMSEEKKPEMEVKLSGKQLTKYFPQSFTPKKMEETIIKLLEQWSKKRQQDITR